MDDCVVYQLCWVGFYVDWWVEGVFCEIPRSFSSALWASRYLWGSQALEILGVLTVYCLWIEKSEEIRLVENERRMTWGLSSSVDMLQKLLRCGGELVVGAVEGFPKCAKVVWMFPGPFVQCGLCHEWRSVLCRVLECTLFRGAQCTCYGFEPIGVAYMCVFRTISWRYERVKSLGVTWLGVNSVSIVRPSRPLRCLGGFE